MKTFNVLPTNEDFRKLTDEQIELILYSIEEDYREADLARRGLTTEADYYDSSFEDEVWNKEPGEWDVLKEGHDPDEIARQVEELTREEDLKNLYSRFDSAEEYNEFLESGGKPSRETEIEQYINRQIEAAQEKAKAIGASKASKKNKGMVDDKDIPEIQDKSQDNLTELDKEAMEKAIQLFNEDDDFEDEYTEI